MALADIVLRGAPDASIGTSDAKNNGLQVMQLEMTQEVIDELLDSVRSGKPPQILFGRAPQLRYGDKTQVLESNTESLRHELYRSDGDGELTFAGVINHTLAVPTAAEVTAGVDTALENLKNNMATLNQEKEARQAIVDAAPYTHRRNISASGRLNPHLLKSSSTSNTPGRSQPSSPAFGASTPSGHHRPTSAPQQDSEKMAAIRKPLVHIIAAGPRQAATVARMLRCKPEEAKLILERIGAPVPEGYKLVDRSYKELDVWQFPYRTEEERQAAIDNAVRAFDRMRTPKDDPLWQKLLPKEERGKGKCLSKLKMNAPTQPAAPTPVKDLKKVLEQKKPVKKEKKQAASTSSGDSGEKKPEKKVARKEPVIRKMVKKAEPSQPVARQPVEKTVEKTVKKAVKSTAKPTVSTPLQKPKKEGGKSASASVTKSPSKPVTTKPKTPSPLSASPPVNASDFEDDHPVHRTLSASASPAKSSSTDRPLKRRPEALAAAKAKADQLRMSTNGRHPSTNGTPSSTERKRKASDLESYRSSDRADTPQHKKRQTEHIKMPAVSQSQSSTHSYMNGLDTSTSPSCSSPTSPPLPLTYQQTIALSQKFRLYYEKYHRLHLRLSKSDKAPSKQERDELWKMHSMLAKMKEEIKAGSRAHH